VIAGVILFLGLTTTSAVAQKPGYKETIVAGSQDKFAEVRHVVLKGSNYDIGRQIGEIAIRDGSVVRPQGNSILNSTKRIYMQKTYPIHYERMRGLAAAYGLDITDDSYDLTGLPQPQFQPSSAGPGCSVIFYPAGYTETGHSILTKNYDFITGDINGRRPQKSGQALMSRPYIFEIYPDKGYSSLSICAFEYFGGVLDGINSEGLVVSILAESESPPKVGMEPGSEVGVHELMCMRYLLDNCKNVDEAREAMLFLKHYYSFIPCHYLIGDRSGKSFIFEFSPARNKSMIIDGNGPQWVTNHLVFLHQKVEEFPETGLNWSMTRYKKLYESLKAKPRFSQGEITAIAESVAIPPNAPGNPERAWNRTLWFSRYDTDNLSLTVKFYLGEKPDPANEKMVVLEYSDTMEFRLKK
jgi:predicted choloylglycine hydrolase